MKVNDIWPLDLSSRLQEGFSDLELDKLCSIRERSIFSAPWLFWTTEVYGLGRCYRDWLKWPKWLPIPAYGDHGICPTAHLFEHELNNKSQIHLTWSKKRAEYNSDVVGRKVIHIEHPWIKWRKENKVKRNIDNKGTLVFFSHTIDGEHINEYNFKDYFKQLNQLPQSYHPLTICMHMHDINKGYHRVIRSCGIPIVTLGNVFSPLFVERFYSLITCFNFATSNSGGSELYYCSEIGIPYFIFGEPPNYKSVSKNAFYNKPYEQIDAIGKEIETTKTMLFSEFPPYITEEKVRFINEMLGSDSQIDPLYLKAVFFKELYRLMPYYIVSKIKSILKRIRIKGLFIRLSA